MFLETLILKMQIYEFFFSQAVDGDGKDVSRGLREII